MKNSLGLREHGRACEDLARAAALEPRLRNAHRKLGEALQSLGRLYRSVLTAG